MKKSKNNQMLKNKSQIEYYKSKIYYDPNLCKEGNQECMVLIGATQNGKSAFLNKIVKAKVAHEGDRSNSETKGIKEYPYKNK